MRQVVLVALFGLPIVLFTGLSLVIMWPTFMLFDWLDKNEVSPKRAFNEVLAPLDEFINSVQNAGSR